MHIINKVLHFGVNPSLSKSEQSKVQLTNVFLVIMFSAVPFYFISFYIIDVSILKKSWGFLFPLLIYPIGMYCSYLGKITAARHFLMIGFISGIFYFLLFLGSGVGVEMFFFVVIALSYLIKPEKSPHFSYLYLVVCIIMMIIGYQNYQTSFTIQMDEKTRMLMAVVMGPMAVILLFVMIKFFNDKIDNFIYETTAQKEQLEHLNKELNHFAYIASHNLNEPVRTMDSFIDIIKEEYHDPKNEDLNVYFTFIEDASSRMHTMIDSLLSYSKIGRELNFQNCNISSIISLVERDLSFLIKENHVNIQKTALPEINCHSLYLQQLFQNLISNAIKFQKPDSNPKIEISCEEKGGFWQFCVADNGIGIHESNLESVFQMFTKIHRSEEYEGSGIGLAFCKKIIDMHGGEIWIKSKENEGSEIYFTIAKDL
ncbi:ATP-binding protein [Flammeovirga aprica]|uniref:histidine kinase n=1 Tax=Flammeovirga aprica JL-4 TaxID=694437 RepID=A0A7X9P362_9BACT|nr:ATP-binding protein [Flammeovirga aprica]NME67557.1 GHKL domain-containing protein [Flammeovirga aprica JL-4]